MQETPAAKQEFRSEVTADEYLGRVFVDVDVNNSSMFVTLLYDVMLDINLPTRSLLTGTDRQTDRQTGCGLECD